MYCVINDEIGNKSEVVINFFKHRREFKTKILIA